jgi:hypothetical protein
VIAGEQQGLVGHPTDISGDDSPVLLMPQHMLANLYLPGDHIKHRYRDSRGIVVSVDEDSRTVSFVEKDTNQEVCTLASVRYMVNVHL